MIKSILGVVVCGALAYMGMSFATGIPEGYYNSVTGKCIGVVNAQGVFPCKDITLHEKVPAAPELTFELLQAKYSK